MFLCVMYELEGGREQSVGLYYLSHLGVGGGEVFHDVNYLKRTSNLMWRSKRNACYIKSRLQSHGLE